MLEETLTPYKQQKQFSWCEMWSYKLSWEPKGTPENKALLRDY